MDRISVTTCSVVSRALGSGRVFAVIRSLEALASVNSYYASRGLEAWRDGIKPLSDSQMTSSGLEAGPRPAESTSLPVVVLSSPS